MNLVSNDMKDCVENTGLQEFKYNALTHCRFVK